MFDVIGVATLLWDWIQAFFGRRRLSARLREQSMTVGVIGGAAPPIVAVQWVLLELSNESAKPAYVTGFRLEQSTGVIDRVLRRGKIVREFEGLSEERTLPGGSSRHGPLTLDESHGVHAIHLGQDQATLSLPKLENLVCVLDGIRKKPRYRLRIEK